MDSTFLSYIPFPLYCLLLAALFCITAVAASLYDRRPSAVVDVSRPTRQLAGATCWPCNFASTNPRPAQFKQS